MEIVYNSQKYNAIKVLIYSIYMVYVYRVKRKTSAALKWQGRTREPAVQETAMTHWPGPNIPVAKHSLSPASHETSKFRPATRAKNTS
jgi:hypothetical protein